MGEAEFLPESRISRRIRTWQSVMLKRGDRTKGFSASNRTEIAFSAKGHRGALVLQSAGESEDERSAA
jgi:hypothetical protein